MSERDEFEAWAKDRYIMDRGQTGPYWFDETESAWDAWQAARATPQHAMPALTDERRRAAAKAMVEIFLGCPPHREPGQLDLQAVDAVARIILAATQPSPEPKEPR